MNYYSKDSKEIVEELQSDIESGLSQGDISEKLSKYGRNELQEEKRKSFLSKLVDQLNDYMVIILIAASIVSMIVGEKTDALVIIAIVIINAFLGIYQEGKAEKALDALKKMSAPESKVLRDGVLKHIPSNELVPGDIVLIEAGDIIPADLRLIEASNLKIDESSLTGESVPVEKNAKILPDEDIGIGDRHNMAYMSSIVSYGRGKAIVVGTGHETEIGKIATMIQSYDSESTPLQNKLNELGKYLAIVVVVICAIVFFIGKLYGKDTLDMFMTAISLAVAAIPEGLPAIVTIVLALGMSRMVERHAIVKKLLAVETLGSITYICSDKTGTLTQNEMTVVRTFTNNEILDVTGTGYNPEGKFLKDEEEVIFDNFNYEALFTGSALCTDATIDRSSSEIGIIGDPTEGALVVVAEKAGYEKSNTESKSPRIDELPFDSERKMMTTVHSNFMPNNLTSFTKGAPDIIIDRCNKILIDGEVKEFTKELKDKALEVNSTFAQSALRVLSVAFKILDENYDKDKLEEELIFIGLLGMIDPPREEAKDAIVKCKKAGIVPVMITGDYKETAYAIAYELGITNDPSQAIMGNELNNMSDIELREIVKEKRVYARVSPEHKVRIIQALKENGEIAAMTGDGVNDALALKKADIGIAMGITGTDVAKNTAEVILTDDNFASIVSAVEEGRIIYSNIKKFVFFLLSCNIGEILIILMSIIFNWEVPLLPIQLLWLNLVTDSFPALALGVEQGHGDMMNEPPRSPNEPILTKPMIRGIAFQSIAITIGTLLAYYWGMKTYVQPEFEHARTIAFATLILAELLRAFSSRSQEQSLLKIGIFTNKAMNVAVLTSFVLLLVVIYVPFLQPIFHTNALNPVDWVVIGVLSIIPLIAGELQKSIFNKK